MVVITVDCKESFNFTYSDDLRNIKEIIPVYIKVFTGLSVFRLEDSVFKHSNIFQ